MTRSPDLDPDLAMMRAQTEASGGSHAGYVQAGRPMKQSSLHRLQTLGARLAENNRLRRSFTNWDEGSIEERIYNRSWRLREKINLTPATCLAGVEIKVRAALIAFRDDEDLECIGSGSFRDLSLSIGRDIMAMKSRQTRRQK